VNAWTLHGVTTLWTLKGGAAAAPGDTVTLTPAIVTVRLVRSVSD
jgi:hypothetical protein